MNPYPIDAYRQLFPDGGKVLLPPFDPAENGDHYQPETNFFEWWYFDATFEDGSHLITVLHSSMFSTIDHKPMLEIRYYPPDGPPVSNIDRFDRSAYYASPDRCWVKINDNLACDEGDYYRLSVDHGLFEVELIFWPELPGWKAGTGHLFADQDSGHYFDWVVPLPCARVEGTLTIAGQKRNVVGLGYHDHNWGNLYLPAAFSRWTWGRVQSDNYTLIFGDVVSRGPVPAHITPFMLAQNGEILLTTDRICVQGEEPTLEPRTGASYFRHLHLSSEEELAIELTLTADQTIETVDFAALHLPIARQHHLRKAAEIAFYLASGMPGISRLVARLVGKGSYLRLKANYRLDLPDHAVEMGEALYEIMYL